MLREALCESDRADIEDTIRKFKSDGNLNILNDAFVVGATCLSTAYSLLTRETVPVKSATPFAAAIESSSAITTCLRPKCQFQIVILDESSQITEPLSLLPLAHFGCERALLVGDPLQLPPTVPNGARWMGQTMADKQIHYGMERTLFERLASCGVKPIMLSTQYRVRYNGILNIH